MLPSLYSSVDELRAAPLGISFDIPAPKSAGPKTPTGVQVYEALRTLLVTASTAADSYCRQVITATQNTENAVLNKYKSWVDQYGTLWFKTENHPIISVSQFRYAPMLGIAPQWVPVPDLTGLVQMEETMIGWPGSFPQRGWNPAQVQVTYLNGYFNTFLSGSVVVPAGSTALPVDDLTGAVPSQEVTLYDLGNTETVQVASSFVPPAAATGGVPTPGNLTLEAPTLYDHTPIPRSSVSGLEQPHDIRVSVLPMDFWWAVMLIAKFQIQERGSSAIVMAATGGIRGRNELRIPQDEIPLEAQLTLDRYAARV